ncbi:AtpZ/AtpI family protein [Pseudooceanicola sp. HF7]|uniref:AtpZ/AtpI family protein n=1 Tax=Pseudooceanicola sp. HF7 TaxID=2721560 RepID=UPI0014321E48|nr:AtpZ/AtpI family protein [Pseudooceanicola sp. HF7]NIZ10733.1 AtpZ/AtpI family protein [Pseudooceanicola sp. HF7]
MAEPDRPGDTPDDHSAQMADLEARIAKAKGVPKDTSSQGGGLGSAEAGWRMVTELVAGLLIGFAIGYGLDWVLGIAPVMMILFTLLGFAAGIKVMLGTARDMTAEPPGADKAGNETRDKDGD